MNVLHRRCAVLDEQATYLHAGRLKRRLDVKALPPDVQKSGVTKKIYSGRIRKPLRESRANAKRSD